MILAATVLSTSADADCPAQFVQSDLSLRLGGELVVRARHTFGWEYVEEGVIIVPVFHLFLHCHSLFPLNLLYF